MSANLWLDAVRDVGGGRKTDLRHFESLEPLEHVGVVVTREMKKPTLTYRLVVQTRRRAAS